MIGFFNGTATAMITPFNEKGVNFTALAKMMDYQIENGTDVLVILGTTGEPATMTDEEKTEVMKFAAYYNKGRAKIVFGTGSNSTEKAVKWSILARKLGADGILAVTPYYNKCTQNGIIKYYQTVCEAAKIPVIAYNVPSRTGVNILPATAEKLAEIPNMAGIKEACGNMQQICETMRRIRGKIDLYSGDDNLNVPILAIGAAGVISVASNVAPKEIKRVYEYVSAGDLNSANQLQDKLLPLINACFAEVNPIPVKAACNMLGFNAGTPRAPLTELEENNKKVMLECIKALELKGL